MRIALAICCLLFVACETLAPPRRAEFFTPPSSRPLSDYQHMYLDPDNPVVVVMATGESRAGSHETIDMNPYIGAYLKRHGFEIVKDPIPGAGVVQWRTTKTTPLFWDMLSVEVTLIITDFETKEIVYQGIGEFDTEGPVNDHTHGLMAALRGIQPALNGEHRPPPVSDGRWKPIQ
jgi:hypothetical protein